MNHQLLKPLAVIVPSGAATYSTALTLQELGAPPPAVGATSTAALIVYLLLLSLMVNTVPSRTS
ncbi:hypothetical protein [Streptomyces sp. MZ04]|uniref:hypothetical protein n=1 Tax=Streptomyces sp. MZ04 TaxID=2559236 RepID=UPI00107EC8C5|nr:hypothetical protein [Streptomyces sp. MZ04]TGB06543.1 hypothetical protein E2651_23305 [Streptomyces sp. MZ04]